MVLPPQGSFSFPGIVAPISGRYHCGHGTQPGRIVLKAAYQATPVLNVGDLTIRYGGQSFAVRDCKVTEQVNYYDGDGGWISEYLLEDRRWRWQFGEIEGNYNRRIGAGQIDAECERTPHELAELLFRAMKEQLFDFSELPNAVRPEVEWVGANPALELQRLADSLGCRLVYDPLTNTAKIRRTGEGAGLPFLNSVDQVGSNKVRPAVPSGVRTIGGLTRVQMALELQSHAEDLDGKIVPSDQLSYDADLVSDTGFSNWWEKEPVKGPREDWFPNITDDAERKLLQKSMWQYYRPVLPGVGDSRSKKLESYFGGNQILDIENVSLTLNEEYFDDELGALSKQGYVAGIFNLDFGGGPFLVGIGAVNNSSKARNDTIFPDNFRVINDHDFPYLIFERPVWKWGGANGDLKTFPSRNTSDESDRLYLICTFNVRNRATGQTCSLHRFNYFYQLSNETSVGPEVYVDDSLVLNPVEPFNAELMSFGPSIQDNTIRDDLLLRSQEITANRARRYEATEAGNASYQEFILVNLDGAIQSVVWSFGEKGATTEVYRNSEPDFVETKYDRRLTFNEIKRKAGVP